MTAPSSDPAALRAEAAVLEAQWRTERLLADRLAIENAEAQLRAKRLLARAVGLRRRADELEEAGRWVGPGVQEAGR